MSNEIQAGSNNLPTTPLPQTVLSNYASETIQIANQKGGIVNIFPQLLGSPVYNASIRFSVEYYNLFVVGGEEFKEGSFIISKDRALTTSEEVYVDISTQFASLTTDNIAEIKTFPSIFASENHQYGHTDENHLAFIGAVTDIMIQENGIKIYFQRFCSILQQRLNELAAILAIKGTPTYNEFNRTHWTIKRVNLIEKLKEAGLNVPVPAFEEK